MAGPSVPRAKKPPAKGKKGSNGKEVAPKRGRGRPVVYGEEVKAEILRRLHNDESLPAILSEPDMPSRWVWARWLSEDPDLAKAHEIAKRVRASKAFDESEKVIDDIAQSQDRQEIYRAEVRSRHLRHLAAVLDPANYSEKMQAAATRAGDQGRSVAIQINIGTDQTGAPQVFNVTPVQTDDADGEKKDEGQ